MSAFRQIGAVTLIGLRNIPARLGPSLVIVVGMACVVGVFISILSMSTGFIRSVENTGRADRAIVLSQGSLFEYASFISRDNALTIADAPGIAKTSDGKPIVSADALSYVVVPKKSDGLDAFLSVRGVGPQGFALRPEIKLTSGRMFNPAAHELIVGKSMLAEFEGLEVGQEIALPDGNWTVTGVFESNGDSHESQLITDAATLLSAMRTNGYKSVRVLLTSPASFDQFKNALTSNPALAVDVSRETDFFAAQSKPLNDFLTSIAYVVGGIMGLGAMFGALNTMYSAVSIRSTEIATLRAIGFGAGAVVTSVLVEALLLALAGALIGAAVAWVAFNGNLHAIGGLVFALAVTPSLVGFGVAFACTLGFIGGLFPAIRAARQPVAIALRAT
jgi:putative ABC transport system permease protein